MKKILLFLNDNIKKSIKILLLISTRQIYKGKKNKKKNKKKKRKGCVKNNASFMLFIGLSNFQEKLLGLVWIKESFA